MFEDLNQNEVSVEAQNAPNLAFYATPILGNTWFNIQAPPNKGEVKMGPPSIPYTSPEAILYFSAMMNPLSAPQTVLSGSNTGQQVISGQITQQDSTQTSRYQSGFQSSTG